MICHVVLIRLRPDISSETISNFLEKANEVLSPIPGVVNLRVGSTIQEDNPHPYCLVMDFADQGALRAYQEHPEHQRFLNDIIGPLVEDKQIFDYDVPGA